MSFSRMMLIPSSHLCKEIAVFMDDRVVTVTLMDAGRFCDTITHCAFLAGSGWL